MNFDKVEELARLEKELNIPSKERLTEWFGDYNMHEPKLQVTEEMITKRLDELIPRMINKPRLFVDLDGTCAKWNPVAEEQLYEKGYYRNLDEYENVVAAVNHIVENHPEVEVYVLSKYLTNSKYAYEEKKEWVKEHLPGIDEAHTILVPIEKDKREMIPGKLTSNDYLLDDYTQNFNGWQPPAHGIKLLNGINHTRGTWTFDRISMMRSSESLADSMLKIICYKERIMDIPPKRDEDFHKGDYEQAVDEVMNQCTNEEMALDNLQE